MVTEYVAEKKKKTSRPVVKRNFYMPHLHLAFRWGDPIGISQIFCVVKLEARGRLVCVILRLAVLVEHRLVTDRRKDRHAMTANTALA